MKQIASGLRFPEGPISLPDGSVVVVEIESGDLSRVTPDGTKSLVGHCGGGPNGAAPGSSTRSGASTPGPTPKSHRKPP